MSKVKNDECVAMRTRVGKKRKREPLPEKDD